MYITTGHSGNPQVARYSVKASCHPDSFALYFQLMVRLITHNLLACHAKGCTTNNFPLAFKDVQIALRETEFNPDFLRNFMPKIEWNALVQAARQVCVSIFWYVDPLCILTCVPVCRIVWFLCDVAWRYELANGAAGDGGRGVFEVAASCAT